jgi:hypothetical protein
MFFGDDFLELVSHFFVIPFLFSEKPLDGSDGHFGLEGDGFAIFAGEGGDESGEIESEIVSGIFVGEAGFEATEQLVQIGTNLGGIGRVHGDSSVNANVNMETCYNFFAIQCKSNSLRCRTKKMV